MRFIAVAAALSGLSLGAADIRVEKQTAKVAYGPVPKVTSFEMKAQDGLLLKDGAARFWVGNGTEFAAIQSGPLAMWLAWLHGYPALSLYPGNAFKGAVAADGASEIGVEILYGNVSWFREAVRLGFMCDFFGNATYGNAWRVSEAVRERPEVKEVLYDHGHYSSVDTGHSIGREMMFQKRFSTAMYFKDEPGVSYLELCREPGPNPSNKRITDDFRAWARTKYGGDIAEANRAWNSSYASWEDVIPMHLDEKRYRYKGAIAELRRRRDAKKNNPAHYYDWLLFVQKDMTRLTKNEIADLRAALPGLPISIDQRAHTSYNDAYAYYDPVEIDPLVDIYSIHYGWHAFAYKNTAYDRKTVLNAASFPLFGMNFFQVNTTKPIINAEDIISRTRAPVSGSETMRKNDIAKLHEGVWKFRLDRKFQGLKQGWQNPKFDDSSWGSMKVPGCWDETPEYAGESCIAWYRRTFKMPASYKGDYEDGSRKFLIYGKGVAQKGTLWLNGHEVGNVKGWDTSYRFDVSELLNWGGENTIVWRVDGGLGKSENGLRFYCHLLANDMISESTPFGEKQYRQMLFTQLMRGLSGVMLWSWHTDYLRPYMPQLFAQLDSVAPVALPALRNRRGNIAYLYGYTAGYGLPCASDGTEAGYLDAYCAIEFSGSRPDVFNEKNFIAEVTPAKYPLLEVPHTAIVSDEAYEHFKKYVQSGGTAVITEDALRQTFSRYRQTDVETFDRGRGKVVALKGRPTMEEFALALKPYLPKPEVGIVSACKAETPLIERMLCGDGESRVLYLNNWGGMDHPLSVTLPAKYRKWRLTPVTGSFRRGKNGKILTTVDSQDVAVAFLTAPGAEVPRIRRPSPLRKKIFDKVLALNRHVTVDKADVLFPKYVEPRDQRAMGAESFPYLLDRVESFGLKHAASEPATWTAETLKGKKLVVLTEGWSCTLERYSVMNASRKDAFVEMIRKYVEDGGSLMVISDGARTANVKAFYLKAFAPVFGVTPGWGIVRDDAKTAFGDPYQSFGNVPLAPKETLEGVKSVLNYVHFPLYYGKGTSSAMVAKTYGKGKVYLSSDVMAFQPFRIEHADNAAFLQNLMGWLLDRPVTAADREKFKKNLFLTEKHLKRIAEEEK